MLDVAEQLNGGWHAASPTPPLSSPFQGKKDRSKILKWPLYRIHVKVFNDLPWSDPCWSGPTEEFSNLLVAGRCISVDHRTHHATKEIPPCMATGEAAGTAAALAVQASVSPKSLDVTSLQRRLRERGVILEV